MATTGTTTTTETNLSKQKFGRLFDQDSQYTKETIRTFEATFGTNYMSAGGLDTTVDTVKYLEPVLNRSSRPKLLDVGCGIGGVGFFFAEQFGADVLGVDVNEVGIQMANKRLQEYPLTKGSCRFQVIDVTQAHFPDESFDIIYSRDALLHIPNETKKALFSKFYQWLTSGGMVCITDYCLGPKAVEQGVSSEFREYLDARGYHLLSPEAYKNVFVSNTDFDEDHVTVEDRQLWYCIMSQREMDRVLLEGPNRERFLKSRTEADAESLVKTYLDKIRMTLRGDRSYVLVHAIKTKAYYNLRTEVVTVYRQMAEDNLIMSCDGNVSVRVSPDLYLVTPSGVEIPDMTPDMVVLCRTQDGKPVERESHKPSSESKNLHNAIYQSRPQVGAIVHTHSIYACALACCRLPLPPAHYAVCELLQTFDFSSREGGSTIQPKDATVQCAPYHCYGTPSLGRATVEALGRHHAVLMANHGALVTGPDLKGAMYNAQRLERECEIYWRSLQLSSIGPTKPLTPREIRDLQAKDANYGQEHPEDE